MLKMNVYARKTKIFVMFVDLMKQIIIIVLGADAYIVTAAPTLMPTPVPTAASTLPGKFLV
jgi:hypothetical protein